MKRLSKRYLRVLSVLLLALLVGIEISANEVRAEVPSGTPTFSNPLNIDNQYFPFQPGGLKIFSGSEHGTKTAAIDRYLTAIRTFKLSANNVACHILVEESYETGELVERSFNYFAQADDGTVYYFGEVVDLFQNGVIVGHEGSWLVGGPGAADPPETGSATKPGLFMPANPELGDMFKPEDLFPIVDETGEVVAVDQDVNAPAGKYDGAIEVRESSRIDPGTELKWYAPGVGVVKVQAKGESLRLDSSTLVQPPDQ